MVPFLIKQLYIDWMCANEYEANKEQEHLHKAYMLRAGFFRIMTTLVDMLEGTEAAQEKAPRIWRCYGESYQTFEAEVLCQQQSQQ